MTRKWLSAAAILFVVGALVPVFVPDIYLRLTAGSSGSGSGIHLLAFLLTLLQWGSFSMGTALAAAGLVVGYLERSGRQDFGGPDNNNLDRIRDRSS
jgi:hypothetical protein